MLGRTTLVIECQLDPSSPPDAGKRLKLWIDKQLFLVLKYDCYDTTGALFIESHFSKLEIDGDIPAERFQLPGGVPIEDTSSSSAPAAK